MDDFWGKVIGGLIVLFLFIGVKSCDRGKGFFGFYKELLGIEKKEVPKLPIKNIVNEDGTIDINNEHRFSGYLNGDKNKKAKVVIDLEEKQIFMGYEINGTFMGGFNYTITGMERWLFTQDNSIICFFYIKSESIDYNVCYVADDEIGFGYADDELDIKSYVSNNSAITFRHLSTDLSKRVKTIKKNVKFE